MNLKQLPKIFIKDRAVQQFQNYVTTWVASIVDSFKNLIPARVVITDGENNLASSIVTTTELENLSGSTENIQEKLTTLQTEVDALETSKLDNPIFQTFTPTVTLVGGAGNTTPVYTTNSGRYITVGKIVFVDVYLNGDGGAEGAGTGKVNIALPLTASTNNTSGLFPCGQSTNGSTRLILMGDIASGGSTIALSKQTSVTAMAEFTGADQNNTSRTITLKFFYEID